MLTIIRGLPGSGKSTLGRRLAAEQNALFIEPDMLMYQNGEYKYDPAAYSVVVGSTYLVLREFFAYTPQAHAVFADVLPRKIDVQHLIQYLHNQRHVKVIDMPLLSVEESIRRNIHRVRREDIEYMAKLWEPWEENNKRKGTK